MFPTAPAYPMAPVQMVYAVPAQRTNSMAIAALVSSLVLAPLGIIFGHIALSQIKHTGEDGKGLAIAGLVIGYLFTGFALLWFVVPAGQAALGRLVLSSGFGSPLLYRLVGALLQAIAIGYIALIITKTYTDSAFAPRRW